MERTMISLESSQKKALTHLAHQSGTSFASLVRKAVRTYLEQDELEAKVNELELLSRQAESSIRSMIDRIDASNRRVDRDLEEIRQLRRARGAEVD